VDEAAYPGYASWPAAVVVDGFTMGKNMCAEAANERWSQGGVFVRMFEEQLRTSNNFVTCKQPTRANLDFLLILNVPFELVCFTAPT
jgi:hypothetical protein